MNLELMDAPSPTFPEVLDAMATYTFASLTQISGGSDDGSAKLVGTGTFLRFNERTFILTAGHVVHELRTTNADGSPVYDAGSLFSVGNGRLLERMSGTWKYWGPPQDLALMEIAQTAFPNIDRVPVSELMLAPDTRDLNNDIYFLHGFPGDKSRYTPIGQGVESKSLPYAGWLADSMASEYVPEIHFAISYPPLGTTDSTGAPADLPKPHGLSGSLIWKTNRLAAGTAWTPHDARVVGLALCYDQVSQCILATRVEYLKGMLRAAIDPSYWSQDSSQNG